MKKIMDVMAWATVAAIVGSIAFLAACEQPSLEQQQAKIEADSRFNRIVSVVGDCQIWQINVPGSHSPYLALCGDKKVPAGMSYQAGDKTKRTVQTIVPQ